MNYTWIFVCFLFGIVNGNLEPCAELTQKLILKDDPNVCDAKSHPVLGNNDQFATVDFSKAENAVLDKFLGQKFTMIMGAIVMEENSQVDHINFAKIGIWNGGYVPQDNIFISIRNNPKLTKFEWNENVMLSIKGNPEASTFVFVYNNPLLDADSLKQIGEAVSKAEHIVAHIQSEPGECFFEDPLDSKKYLTPIPEILESCRIIKGDFILDGGKLKEKLKLVDGGCLKLTGVNMDGVTVEASPGKGKDICKDGTTKSEVTGNLNLCGQELKKLAEYFPAGSAVRIKMDPGTCTIECQNAADVTDKYNYCKTITTGALITDWFTNEDLKEKANHLVSSHHIKISGVSTTKISLPKLTNAIGLIIKNSTELTDLDLPALNSVTTLIMEGNPKLTLATMNKALAKIEPTTSRVICRLTESDVIKDINDLRFCSTIIGPLTLDGLEDFDKTKKALKHLKRILGKLKIDNSQAESIEFPSLEEIRAPTAPALQITNNLLLKSLTMLMLQNITVADGTNPAIKITGNKQLDQEALKGFLTPEYYKYCIVKTDECEYVDSVDWWIKFVIIYGCAFSLLFLVGGVAIYYAVKMKKQFARLEREMEEELKKEEEEEKAEKEKEEKEEKEAKEKEAKEKERKRKIDEGTKTAKEPDYVPPPGMRRECHWLAKKDSLSDIPYRIDEKKAKMPGYIPDEQKKQHEWAACVLNKSPQQLKAEFRTLVNFKSENMTTIAFMANPTKNRYPNVPCQDDHRVELIHPKWPGVKMTCDYIHANLVGWNKWAHRHPYILTQAPMKSTLFDFWFMIVQEVVKHTVMLGETIEAGKEMCHQYWPKNKGEKMTVKQDGIEIVVINKGTQSNRLSQQEPGIRQTLLLIKCSNGTQIPHTHYQVDWPEGGTPPPPKTLIHLFSTLQWKRMPVVVHCSDGVGRSGTVAGIGYTLAMIRDGYHYTQMDEVLKHIRSTRAGAITDDMHYVYIHRVVLMYCLERHKKEFGPLLEKQGNREKYKKWCELYDKEFDEYQKRVAGQKKMK